MDKDTQRYELSLYDPLNGDLIHILEIHVPAIEIGEARFEIRDGETGMVVYEGFMPQEKDDREAVNPLAWKERDRF